MQFDLNEVCDGRSPNPSLSGGFYPAEGADSFEIAYSNAEKIINCSAFRRMQGKTQVYPFPETGAVRNRLTHSIEVAHIGQAIAARVFARVDCDEGVRRAAQQIVNNGCLLHDIGNSPFGHGGESAIREFFRVPSDLDIIKHACQNDRFKNDLIWFDGNAQGFRIATTLNGRKYAGGLRLGAATLTSMIKYPYASADREGKIGKFGFMESEDSLFRRVFEACGIMDKQGVVYRSPLSLVVEAADDIAYLTADIQDAFVSGDLVFSYAKGELDLLAQGSGAPNLAREKIDERDTISEMRSLAVNRMISVASECLYNEIFKKQRMIGRYERISFWGNGAGQSVEASEGRIRAKSNERIYRGRRKIALQVAGGRIIKFVLAMQISALNDVYTYLLKNRVSGDMIPDHLQEKLRGSPSLEKVADYLFENLEEGLDSRESAQIILRMPSESHVRIRRLFVESCEALSNAGKETLMTDWRISSSSSLWTSCPAQPIDILVTTARNGPVRH